MPVKLTESYLRKIIREEVSRLLNEEQRMSFEDAFRKQYGTEPHYGYAGFINMSPRLRQEVKDLYDSNPNMSVKDAVENVAKSEINKMKMQNNQ